MTRRRKPNGLAAPYALPVGMCFTLVGIVMLANTTNLLTLSTFDVGVLIFEIVVSLGVGSAMGAMAKPNRSAAVAAHLVTN